MHVIYHLEIQDASCAHEICVRSAKSDPKKTQSSPGSSLHENYTLTYTLKGESLDSPS